MAQTLVTSAVAPASGVLSTSTTSVMQTYPVEQGGGCITWGTNVGINATTGAQAFSNSSGISTTELNSDSRIGTTNSVATDGGDLYSDLQNLVALWCRATGAAAACGLSNVTFNGVLQVMTPRAVLFRLQQMINAMLSQPNVA